MRLVWNSFLTPLSSDRAKEPFQPLFFCFHRRAYGTAVSSFSLRFRGCPTGLIPPARIQSLRSVSSINLRPVFRTDLIDFVLQCFQIVVIVRPVIRQASASDK